MYAQSLGLMEEDSDTTKEENCLGMAVVATFWGLWRECNNRTFNNKASLIMDAYLLSFLCPGFARDDVAKALSNSPRLVGVDSGMSTTGDQSTSSQE